MRPSISFGAQFGDEASANQVLTHYQALKELLGQHLLGPYSTEAVEFAPVLRVDGSIWHWGFRGVQKVRRSYKDGYITADIGMPISEWEQRTPFEIRLYLFEYVEEALDTFVRRLKKDKLEIDEMRLRADLKEVRDRFLDPSG